MKSSRRHPFVSKPSPENSFEISSLVKVSSSDRRTSAYAAGRVGRRNSKERDIWPHLLNFQAYRLSQAHMVELSLSSLDLAANGQAFFCKILDRVSFICKCHVFADWKSIIVVKHEFGGHFIKLTSGCSLIGT